MIPALASLTDAQLDELAGAIESERARRRPRLAELDGWRIAEWRPRPGGGLVDFTLMRGDGLEPDEEFEAVDLGNRDRAWALAWATEQIAERRRFLEERAGQEEAR